MLQAAWTAGEKKLERHRFIQPWARQQYSPWQIAYCSELHKAFNIEAL